MWLHLKGIATAPASCGEIWAQAPRKVSTVHKNERLLQRTKSSRDVRSGLPFVSDVAASLRVLTDHCGEGRAAQSNHGIHLKKTYNWRENARIAINRQITCSGPSQDSESAAHSCRKGCRMAKKPKDRNYLALRDSNENLDFGRLIADHDDDLAQ